ncbi:MAG: prepilin-type N-terminal cleavage/methylation domain-containing protein, partial [Desulfobacterales bacterium]
MLQKLRGSNSKGFTLIELMIVIAIIGILAAIAIPNFIQYRNKAFCSRAETDANTVEAA